MLREIRVYGRLAKFLGRRVFKADVSTAGEAMRFLLANFPKLEQHMADQHYKISIGGYDLGLDELTNPAGLQPIRIVPVVGGAGFWGNFAKILAGVAIVAAALLFAPGAALASAAFTLGPTAVSIAVGVGVSLALSGVSGLITPVPQITPMGLGTGGLSTSRETELDPQKSYSFSGIQNTSRSGTSVPLIYGETIVGSVVISAGIDTVQVAV